MPFFQIRMGLTMTPQQFYSQRESFVQNVAAILGVPSDRIVVVAINPGDYESIDGRRRRRLAEDGIVYDENATAGKKIICWVHFHLKRVTKLDTANGSF